MIYKDLNSLNEARDYPLYHGTDIDSALAIIQSNKLLGSSYAKDGRTGEEADSSGKVICFTRNNAFMLWSSEVRFKLDANKLAHNYKIVNYMQIGQTTVDYGTFKKVMNEYEERIYVAEIPNLDKYILEVQLVDDGVEAFTRRFKKLDLDSIDDLKYRDRNPAILNVVALANEKGWITDYHKQELEGKVAAKPLRSAYSRGGALTHNNQYDKQNILSNIADSKKAREVSNQKIFNDKVNDINMANENITKFDIKNFKISEDIVKRENSVSMFRRGDLDHNKELQKHLQFYKDKVDEFIQNCPYEPINNKLQGRFEKFCKDYTNAMTAYLNHRANNPSWAVTGRGGLNKAKYDKAMDRQDKLISNISTCDDMIDKALRLARQDFAEQSKKDEKEAIDNLVATKELPKFASKEVVVGGKIKKGPSLAGYVILKDWGAYRIYAPSGKEIHSMKTTETQKQAKEWLFYYVTKHGLLDKAEQVSTESTKMKKTVTKVIHEEGNFRLIERDGAYSIQTNKEGKWKVYKESAFGSFSKLTEDLAKQYYTYVMLVGGYMTFKRHEVTNDKYNKKYAELFGDKKPVETDNDVKTENPQPQETNNNTSENNTFIEMLKNVTGLEPQVSKLGVITVKLNENGVSKKISINKHLMMAIVGIPWEKDIDSFNTFCKETELFSEMKHFGFTMTVTKQNSEKEFMFSKKVSHKGDFDGPAVNVDENLIREFWVDVTKACARARELKYLYENPPKDNVVQFPVAEEEEPMTPVEILLDDLSRIRDCDNIEVVLDGNSIDFVFKAGMGEITTIDAKDYGVDSTNLEEVLKQVKEKTQLMIFKDNRNRYVNSLKELITIDELDNQLLDIVSIEELDGCYQIVYRNDKDIKAYMNVYFTKNIGEFVVDFKIIEDNLDNPNFSKLQCMNKAVKETILNDIKGSSLSRRQYMYDRLEDGMSLVINDIKSAWVSFKGTVDDIQQFIDEDNAILQDPTLYRVNLEDLAYKVLGSRPSRVNKAGSVQYDRLAIGTDMAFGRIKVSDNKVIASIHTRFSEEELKVNQENISVLKALGYELKKTDFYMQTKVTDVEQALHDIYDDFQNACTVVCDIAKDLQEKPVEVEPELIHSEYKIETEGCSLFIKATAIGQQKASIDNFEIIDNQGKKVVSTFGVNSYVSMVQDYEDIIRFLLQHDSWKTVSNFIETGRSQELHVAKRNIERELKLREKEGYWNNIRQQIELLDNELPSVLDNAIVRFNVSRTRARILVPIGPLGGATTSMVAGVLKDFAKPLNHIQELVAHIGNVVEFEGIARADEPKERPHNLQTATLDVLEKVITFLKSNKPIVTKPQEVESKNVEEVIDITSNNEGVEQLDTNIPNVTAQKEIKKVPRSKKKYNVKILINLPVSTGKFGMQSYSKIENLGFRCDGTELLLDKVIDDLDIYLPDIMEKYNNVLLLLKQELEQVEIRATKNKFGVYKETAIGGDSVQLFVALQAGGSKMYKLEIKNKDKQDDIINYFLNKNFYKGNDNALYKEVFTNDNAEQYNLIQHIKQLDNLLKEPVQQDTPAPKAETMAKLSMVSDESQREQLKKLQVIAKKFAPEVDADPSINLIFIEEPRELKRFKLPTVALAMINYNMSLTKQELNNNQVFKRFKKAKGTVGLGDWFTIEDSNGKPCKMCLFLDKDFEKASDDNRKLVSKLYRKFRMMESIGDTIKVCGIDMLLESYDLYTATFKYEDVTIKLKDTEMYLYETTQCDAVCVDSKKDDMIRKVVKARKLKKRKNND